MNMKSLFSIVVTILTITSLPVLEANAQKERSSRSFVAKDLVDIKTLPAWLSEAMVREKTVKKKSKFKLKEFNVNKKIPGKIKLIDQDDGVWLYQIDIGTDSPVECYVVSEFDGPANSLYGIVDSSFAGIENINGKPVSDKFNYSIGSGVFSGTPYLLLDTLYLVGEGAEKKSGVLKALSAETDNSLQICMHNEIGYRETFFSVFKSFVSAFTENDEGSEFFETIIQMTFNDIPVGYSREKYTVDKDGDIEELNESSVMIPVDASSVSRSDSKASSWSRVDGSLINGTVYSVDNGVLSSNLTIDAQNEKWEVAGEFQGKEVKYELAYQDWLLSNYGFYKGMQSLVESDQSKSDYHMWLPDADPSSALKVVMSKLLDNPDANFKLSLGPITMDILAESNGVFNKGVLNQGPVKLNLNNIYLKGEPSL